jgi:hypothetical protein
MDAILITAWDALVNTFLGMFTQPTGLLFTRLLTGWILCNSRRTITGMLRWADPGGIRAHDAYHRFFTDSPWIMTELWRSVTGILVQCFCRSGTVIVDFDDTLFHHIGRKVNGAGWWRDAVRSTGTRIVYAWGLNIVVLTLRVNPPWGGEPLGLPINMRLHRKQGHTLTELAQAMLRQVTEWLPERQFIACGDGFYASLVGARIPRVHWVSRIRRDAVLYELPPQKPKKTRGRPRKRGRKLGAPEKMASHVQHWRKVTTRERGQERVRLVYVRRVLWYHVSKEPVLLVISRDPTGKEHDDFFVTTDAALTGDEVVSVFAGRWCIEDTFKNTKQFLGGQQPQTRKGQGPERAAALSLWLYSLVWLWYLRQNHCQRTFIAWPWYPNKTTPSFVDALISLRRALWQERIKSMFGKQVVHDKKYEFLIEALASAA